jgi:prepilin-type N-terminal cleavage/methylation domain-containing protein
MKENFHSQKGLTLVEVLVSIVLLAIILTSFMGFFTQSALFTKKSEQKLDTMQTAQKYINLIEKYIYSEDLSTYDLTQKVTLSKEQLDLLLDLDTPILSPYTIKAEILTNTTDSNVPVGLIQFKIVVVDPQNAVNKSTTYTYLRK